MSCDWCEGRTWELFEGEDVSADIDSETGLLTVYLRNQVAGYRHIKYCPMCGKRIGLQKILKGENDNV